MKYHICFIGNFYKTAVYEAIADELVKRDCESYWIIPNPTQYKYYSEKYGKDRVLLIDQTIISDEAEPIADLKINEIIYGDRIWKYQKEKGIKYLTSLQSLAYSFLQKNRIQTVFGEDTTAEELLICRLCKVREDLKCKFFSLGTARIPYGRFFFFEDEKQSCVWKGKTVPADDEEITVEVRKPEYLARNDAIVKKQMSVMGMVRRLGYFISGKHIDKTDPDVLTDKLLRFKVKTREVINQLEYPRVNRQDISSFKDKKFVFYGFHKQPESSIDVCGRYNEDQFQSIINIWRQLPPDWFLLIKEHSNAIGDRSLSYFRKFNKFPHIILLDERMDSHEIMENAQLVVTNTGTIGLEAALKGIPAVSLSKVVFNCLNYCRFMNWEDFEKYDSLEDLVREIRSLPQNVEAYKELLKKYSFKGYMGDTNSKPRMLEDKENMANLADAFYAASKWMEPGMKEY